MKLDIKHSVSLIVARIDPFAASVAAVMFCLALTPSLLPRSWFVQGLICGFALVIGYALGMLAKGPVKRDKTRKYVLAAAALSLPVSMLVMLPAHIHDFDALGYTTAEKVKYVSIIIVAAVVVFITTLIWLALRYIFKFITKRVGKLLPSFIAGFLALAICGLLVTISVSRTIHDRLIASVNSSMQHRDTTISDDEEFTKPQNTKLSWQLVGYEGRRFLARGPSKKDIEQITRRAAKNPVRVYVGRASTKDPGDFREAAQLALQELNRMEGFNRSVIHIATPTGTGWVNEQFIQPVEYFLDGDVATVAVQYSHLPSAFALLDDRTAAIESTRYLRSAIDKQIAKIPQGKRPRIFVSGESLGSFGGGGVFKNLDDMVKRADAGMWTGAPAFNSLRREAENRRDKGSLQIHPRISALPELAFGQAKKDFKRRGIRFAFLQNADDPFMWWDTSLIVRRPDWLREPLDKRLNPSLRWIPLVTWIQIGLDQKVGNDFKEGQGHLYGTLPLDAWQSIIRPEGWSEQEVRTLRHRLQRVER